MPENYLRKMCRYKQWANEKIYAALKALPADILTMERKIVFGSMLATLHHAYLMDTVWKCHLEGSPHAVTSRDPKNSPSLEVLFIHQVEVDAWFVNYAESLHSDLLEDVVAFDFIGGERGSMSRQDIVMHVVNHTTYHRGHIAGMMYESGAAPPTTDLPVFLRDYG